MKLVEMVKVLDSGRQELGDVVVTRINNVAVDGARKYKKHVGWAV